jgi:hypothetical protein
VAIKINTCNVEDVVTERHEIDICEAIEMHKPEHPGFLYLRTVDESLRDTRPEWEACTSCPRAYERANLVVEEKTRRESSY